MSTIKDFENAPIGATATHKVTGTRAMKMNNDEWCWIVKDGFYKDNEGMMYCDYTLDAPAPTTAREALDIAWELAHPVKPGQVIPKGTHVLRLVGGQVRVFQNIWGFDGIAPHELPYFRTLEPLPDPEPDWLDAPAVMARVEGWVSCHDPQVFTRENKTGTQWVLDTKVYHWSELEDVTALYPKEQA